VRRNGSQGRLSPMVATVRSKVGEAAIDDARSIDQRQASCLVPCPSVPLLYAESRSATYRCVMSPGSATIYRQRDSTRRSPDNPHGCWFFRPGFTVNLEIDLTVNFCRELNATPLPSNLPSD
jgi:hypothetical protein